MNTFSRPILGIFVLTLSSALLTNVAATENAAIWQKKAEVAFDEIERTLEENHPGAAKESKNAFTAWSMTAKNLAPEKLTLVKDLHSYQDFLRWHTRGFNDGHLSISFPDEQQTQTEVEWPGFLATYDPKFKSFVLSRQIDDLIPASKNVLGHAHKFIRLLKINGQNPQEWIDKNCTPFYNGPILGCESAYTKMAPWALVTTNNPFAEKPTNITVGALISCRCIDGAKKAMQTIELPCLRTNAQTISKAVKDARAFDSNHMAKLIVLEKKRHSFAYFRLPTFAPQNESQKKALEGVILRAHKANSYKNIIFDIRGNAGGSSTFAEKLLRNIFGHDYVDYCLYKAAEKEVVSWRASTGNIAFLKSLAQNGHPLLQLPEEAKTWALDRASKLKNALEAGSTFYTETHSMPEIKTLPKKSSLARVFIIIDAQNASAALDFIDYAKACGDVVLLGQPTSADSVYMETRTADLGTDDAKFTLVLPMKEYQNRTRGHNQPYLPDILWDNQKAHAYPRNTKEIPGLIW